MIFTSDTIRLYLVISGRQMAQLPLGYVNSFSSGDFHQAPCGVALSACYPGLVPSPIHAAC